MFSVGFFVNFFFLVMTGDGGMVVGFILVNFGIFFFVATQAAHLVVILINIYIHMYITFTEFI